MKARTFCVFHKDLSVLKQSSSGGVFCAISLYFLKNINGIVYATIIEQNKAFIKRIESDAEIKLAMGSKYVFSNIGDSFKKCALDLQNGKEVFYVGLPCQINALLNFLDFHRISTDKLLTCDLICHGAPKDLFLQKYLEEIFGDQRQDLVIRFREKRPSWRQFSILIKSKSREYRKIYTKDPYLYFFLNNYTLCDSCYNCKFKGENRSADLTIGDFWGVEKVLQHNYSDDGTSLVIVRKQLSKILKILNVSCVVSEVDYSTAISHNVAYFKNPSKPVDHHFILSMINTKGFKKAYRYKTSLVSRAVRKVSNKLKFREHI